MKTDAAQLAGWSLLSISATQEGSSVHAELELEQPGVYEYAYVTVRLGVDSDPWNHQTSLGDLVVEGDASEELRAWVADNESSVAHAVWMAA